MQRYDISEKGFRLSIILTINICKLGPLFYPHSDIAFYKVGLGTSQHVANVYEFTNVGLKKGILDLSVD